MSVNTYCIICHQPLDSPHQYGGRSYCDIHIHQFTENFPAVWRTTFILVGLLIGLVGISVGLHELLSPPPTGIIQLGLNLIIALLPGIVWPVLLYRTTREQENAIPNFVVMAFIGSVLFAAAATRPLLFDLINIDEWLWQTNSVNRFLGTILINGFYHTFVIYAGIRYTVWQTSTFNRRIDGVMYGLAIALGYASTLNILFVLDRGGISFLNGGLRMITDLCAFLTPSLIIGYILGRNRFEDMPFYYAAMGQAFAAVLNGFLLFAGTELNNVRLGADQDGFSPWPGLVLNMLFLVATLGAVYGLIQRHNNLTKARLGQEQ